MHLTYASITMQCILILSEDYFVAFYSIIRAMKPGSLQLERNNTVTY